MNLVWKIAWRNLWRHKGKCLVIGLILFIGSFFMTVGNSIISGMDRGLAENIVDLFTGDLVIVSKEQENDNVLLDMMSAKPLKVIKEYDEVATLMDNDMVDAFLPATSGVVFVLDTEVEMATYALLGVDIERYREMFPDNFKLIEGEGFRAGERGILVSRTTRDLTYSVMDFWLIPEGEELNETNLSDEAKEFVDVLRTRSDLVFMGSSSSGSFFDIRVPVKGIMEYRALNQIWGNYSIVDIESFREAHNYVTGQDAEVIISDQQKELLTTDSFDDLFSTEMLITETVVSDDEVFAQDLQAVTDETAINHDLDAGSYNLIFVRLADGVTQRDAIKRLNAIFTENGVDARAVAWQDAVGIIGNMAVFVKAALNIFVMCIFFVAIIIIMNTLSMAALERITELGMMRAIGAQKGFLKRMFLTETGVLAFFFGGLGLLVGVVVVFLLRSANITTTNEILQLVYGGTSFNPVFTFTDLIIGVLELGIVTLLSVFYPLRVVGKIVPLDAIARD